VFGFGFGFGFGVGADVTTTQLRHSSVETSPVVISWRTGETI
jgi:hypothetical protein